MHVSKSFVINADLVTAYDVTLDFFLAHGYREQTVTRPTLLVLKRRGSLQDPSKTGDARINLRASFKPVGDLQLYSAALLAIRCEYDVKVAGETVPLSGRAVLECEVEDLRRHLIEKIPQEPAPTLPVARSTTTTQIVKRPSSVERIERGQLQAKLIQAKLIQRGTAIKIGEEVNLEIQVTNTGEKPLLLTKVENILPRGFQLSSKSDNCFLEDEHLTIKGYRLAPMESNEIRIGFKPFRKGTFEVKPKIFYVDEDGRKMFIEPDPMIFNISEAPIPGRIATGYEDLDNLLFGGIPENYGVVLNSPSCDERELLIRRFLEAGAKTGETTFHVTVEPGNTGALAEEYPSNFHLFVCNPRADVIIKSAPNVFKLKGVENLTDIGIALTKTFRILNTSNKGPRRACIEILSDVLLQHNIIITRKWLAELLPDLKAKGFTTLAVINSFMHPQEEVHAILGLFEGEIKISEKETNEGIRKVLRIRKMYNKQYLENELTLTREKLSYG